MTFFLQNCLHLQPTTMGCLGKASDDVLDTSMALASKFAVEQKGQFSQTLS